MTTSRVDGLPAAGEGEAQPEADHDAIRRRASVHPAVADDDLAVGVRGDPGLVGDEDDGGALLAGGADQQVHDLLAGERVQRAGRLVGEEDLGLGDQPAGERDPLRLAAGQLAGAALLQARRGPSRSNQAARPRQRRARRRTPLSSSGRATFSSAVSSGTSWPNWKTNPNRSRRRALRSVSADGVDPAPVEVDLAGVGHEDAGQAVQQRRLARSRSGPITARISPAATATRRAAQRRGLPNESRDVAGLDRGWS